MLKNMSVESTTLKEEYLKSNSDAWTIDKVMTYIQYQPNLVVPYENILDKYEDYFSEYLIDIEVDSIYFKKPAMFSEFYYGDPSLYWIILYFAKIPSITKFTKRKIKILPVDRLKDLNQLFIQYKDKIAESNKNPFKYKMD